MKTVIFACVHNAGRSQMAAAWFNRLADPTKARAISAGTQPGPRVHPEVQSAMAEVGIDLSEAKPQLLTDSLAAGARLLITMGCGEACPHVPGLRRADWPLEDPKNKPVDRVREIRDDIRERVAELLRREGWVASATSASESFVLQTPRLSLRPLRDDDLGAFAAMHADARFMQYLAAPLSQAESAGALSRLRASYDEVGFGPWGVELREQPGLIGVVGLSRSRLEVPFAPCVEIVWRLAPEHWGRGYATEAARAALGYGFTTLSLPEILAWTTPANQASIRVMEKLGMARDPSEDFDHPRLPVGHPLRRHVLYRARAGR
jgi:arsenate reductase